MERPMLMQCSPQETSHYVFQQPIRPLIHQVLHHITQHAAHGVKPLVSLADIIQAHVVEQDLLHDEDGDRLAELGAGLHDAEAERDDLGGKEEVDHVGGVVLNEGADHAERGQAQVFEGAGLGGRIEEWIEEERDVCY